MDLTEDATFKRAVEYAKAYVRARGETEITPVSVLLGLHRVLTGDDRPDLPSELQVQAPLLVEATRGLTGYTGSPPPDQSPPLPVSVALRTILAKATDYTMLVEMLVDQPKPGLLESLDAYQIILGRAATWARRAEVSVIPAGPFAVAAYFAYRAGDLANHPGVLWTIALSVEALRELANSNQWTAEDFAPGSPAGFQLEENLRQEVVLSYTGEAQLTTALTAGIAEGHRVLDAWATAIHEAGHAVAAALLIPEDPVIQVTIVPGSRYQGLTRTDGRLFRFTRQKVLNKVCVFLAGGIAVSIKFGLNEMETGWQSDLRQATELVWTMICDLGLDPEFGPINLEWISENLKGSRFKLIDDAQVRLQAILREQHQRTKSLLQENWSQVQAIAAAVLKKRVIGHEEVLEAFDRTHALTHNQDLKIIQSRAIVRDVDFAVSEGEIATQEGPMRHEAGAAIITGESGEKWPVEIQKFRFLYEPVPPTVMGQPGRYRKTVRRFRASQITERRQIVAKKLGVLAGGVGDWIVDGGYGDSWIITGSEFERTYEIVDNPNDEQMSEPPAVKQS